MRLPRSLSGMELAALLRRSYGYHVIRQTGSHMRLASDYKGYEHRISIPIHNPLKVGTLSGVLGEVAYLEIGEGQLARELFQG